MDIQDVEKLLRNHMAAFTSVEKIDNEVNLLDSSVGIYVNDWLYIFTYLEKEMNKPICKILEKMECVDFTIEGISRRIVALF